MKKMVGFGALVLAVEGAWVLAQADVSVPTQAPVVAREVVAGTAASRRCSAREARRASP